MTTDKAPAPWPGREREMDRRLVQVASAPDGRREAYKSHSVIGRRLDDAMREANLLTTVASPKGRKHWWVLTAAGQEALPAAKERHLARERADMARRRADALEAHREAQLGSIAWDLLVLARTLAAIQVPDDLPDTAALNEPLTAGMVRAARAAVAVADVPLPADE